MKNITALLALAISLSALTVWSQPAPARRGDNTPRDSNPPPEMRRGDANQRQAGAQRMRAQRGKQLRQREFVPGPRGLPRGSGRRFSPNAGPMARPDFAPYRGGRYGSAPGGMPRGFGAPPMMDQRRQGMGGPGGGQFRPPMGRGQFRPDMGPGAGPSRRGFAGPPMMDQPRQGRGGQFQPPSGPRPGRPDMDRGAGPMRRGSGGPPMLNQRGPLPRHDLDSSGREPGTRRSNDLRRGQDRSGDKDELSRPLRPREGNSGRGSKVPSERDQN